ncbi:MAG: hypothetical protein Q8755_03530, partial [Candidatus Phytoplasma australasiaticum]|nr:hypothetical protein [Candidatus Phytoplasma australasiaticum]
MGEKYGKIKAKPFVKIEAASTSTLKAETSSGSFSEKSSETEVTLCLNCSKKVKMYKEHNISLVEDFNKLCEANR